ncbi:MAG: PAS domain S-box protein [Methylophilaceae bacterium]
MKLRLRLNLLITLVMLFFILILGGVIMVASKQSIEEGVESAHSVTLQLLDSVIISSTQNPEWGHTHEVMKAYLEDLGRVRSNMIYLYDLQNNLLYQSPQSTYRLNENPPAWFVKALAPRSVVNARLIRFGRLVVQSDSIGAIKEAWAVMGQLFYLTLSFLIVLNVIVYFLLGRWLRPLNPMLDAISSMGRGDFKTRLPKFQIPDFDLISDNFNKMGAKLEKNINENLRLALIAEQTADAVAIYDDKQKIRFWNKSAERIFGYKKNEVMGQHANLIVPKNLRREFKDYADLARKKQAVLYYETKRKAKNGRLIDLSISRSPLVDPNSKKVVGDIVSMRDISEKILAERSQRELQQNRELTAIIQEHVEDERKSLARELHDELGQYVSAIKIFSQNILNRTKGKDKAISDSATTVISAANQIYDGMHSIIKKLRPGSLDNLGLTETLRDMVNSWNQQYEKLNVKLKIDGDIDQLGEMANINIYRIIQEGMNNCVKHANASLVNIKLSMKKDQLTLLFKDNGVGFDKKILESTKQFGLVGIDERVKALNGQFEVVSEIDHGTEIRIILPIKN